MSLPVPAPAPGLGPRPVPEPVRPTENFIEIGRIPDFLKDLRSFNGNPTELMNWILDVEGIFNMYRHIPVESLQYDLIEKSIRRRITGEAADVLNANNVASNWTEIKSTLLLYYSDKRELKTLDFELTTIKKGQTESLSCYYSRVNELLSAIIAQVQTDEKYRDNAAVYIDYFREKALDSFIRGHERNLSLLLKTAKPKTLSSAYQFCLDYHNMDIRSGPLRNETSNVSLPKPRELEVPRLPPRPPPRLLVKPPMALAPQPPPRRLFAPFPQRPMQHQGFSRPFMPTNPQRANQFGQINQPKPEPMDVDPSVRSRNINYGNRPQFNFKRPHPPSQQFQNFKRVAHPVEYEADPYEYYNYYPDHYYQEEEIDYYDHSDFSEQFEMPTYHEDDPQPSTSSQQSSESNVLKNDENTANFLEWKTSW